MNPERRKGPLTPALSPSSDAKAMEDGSEGKREKVGSRSAEVGSWKVSCSFRTCSRTMNPNERTSPSPHRMGRGRYARAFFPFPGSSKREGAVHNMEPGNKGKTLWEMFMERLHGASNGAGIAFANPLDLRV